MTQTAHTTLRFAGHLTMSVPEAGRQLYGIGRDAAYAAVERGEIPAVRVGRSLRVPTHAALRQLGWSEDHIARVLGLPEQAEAAPASAAPADVQPLTNESGGPQHAA